MKRHFLFLCLAIFCVEVFAADEKEAWVAEEVLLQLLQIKQELVALKQDVSNLNSKIDLIATGGSVPSGIGPLGPSVISLNDRPVLGSDDAEFAIVEFTDFECPFCARHSAQVYPDIKSEFIEKGVAKYVVYDFPLAMHPSAHGASIAANCAGEQGKYWEMHDLLYLNARRLSRDFYLETAINLQIELEEFSSCLENPEQSQAVDESLAYGTTLGVSGTPKFFVGRIEGEELKGIITIEGAQPFSSFRSAINRLTE